MLFEGCNNNGFGEPKDLESRKPFKDSDKWFRTIAFLKSHLSDRRIFFKKKPG